MNLNKLIVTLAILLTSINLSAQDFYVSPAGSDQADGLSMQADQQANTGPFQTLERAKQAIRTLKTSGQFKHPVTIHLMDGDYKLQKPLEFDIRDTGFVDREITWQADNGPAIISGGIALTNCQQNPDGLWSCPVKDLNLDSIKYSNVTPKMGAIPGFNLFVSQKRCHLARWPDKGWAHIKTPLDEKTEFTSFEPLPQISTDQAQMQIHIFPGNDWYDQYLPVTSVDSSRNSLKLAAATVYPLAFSRRFYLQNIRSELNAPEEWFYDQANANIFFIPPEHSLTGNIVVSALPNLIKLERAHHIKFKNLIFQHSTATAITLNNAANISFDGVEISHVDGTAVEAVSSNTINISDSRIYDTGERGIALEGGDRNTLQAANNIVHNNHIHDFGTIILSASPAIEVKGVGSRITHNLIEQAAGTGVSITGNDHLFEKNEVRHVCEQSDDCGAIYSGRNWSWRGNIIRYNSIHDLYGYGLRSQDIGNNLFNYGPGGVSGVYLDDGLSGFTVTGNLLNNAGAISIFVAGGRDNRVENNFIFSRDCAICVGIRGPDYNWETNQKSLTDMPYLSPVWQKKYPDLARPITNIGWPLGNTIKTNIIITTKDDGKAFDYNLPSQGNTLTNNLVWGAGGKVGVYYNILDKPGHQAYTSWQTWISEGVEKNSMLADPCATITGNKLSFCSGSPVNKIGFKALPTDIGLIE